MIIHNVEQGTPEWHKARTGVITASTVGALLTPTWKSASNDKSRRVVADLFAERLSGYSEELPTTFDMQRGHDDEVMAKTAYSDKIAPVTDAGFITEDKWGFTLGYSPDGLVGDDGLIECKSMKHGIHVDVVISQTVPSRFMAQIQTGLLVTGRAWLDCIMPPAFGGGNMMIVRVLPDEKIQTAILEAAQKAEEQIAEMSAAYHKALDNPALRFVYLERREPENDGEIVIDG